MKVLHRLIRGAAAMAATALVACGHPVNKAATETPAESPRYTFSWPLDADAPKPRGGTTRGAPVVRDLAPSPAWHALQADGLPAQERDRRAILAMAGSYRVTFDFVEVAGYGARQSPPAPYQSWGTEKVFVDRDEPGFVSLVHILEMHMVGPDGKPGEPIVTKHWRQDWRYEPSALVEYRGRERWERRMLSDVERRGAWMQAVYQVDESPRYASLGRWHHNGSFSTWLSGDTWRPLPRREWSVRNDYQVLIGTNRHTVGPSGWTQEENNLKAVLTDARQLDASRPYLGREYGMARYERLREAPFAAADRYFDRTRVFWDRVRDSWDAAFDARGAVTLRGPVDRLGLFRPLFEHADKIEQDGAGAPEEDEKVIRAALSDMGVGR